MTKYQITARVAGIGKIQHVITKPTLDEAKAKFRRAYPGKSVEFCRYEKEREHD